jgi:hypothetical protein
MSVDALMQTVLGNLVRNLPPDVLEKIQQIGQAVATFDTRLAQVERTTALIAQKLGVDENGQRNGIDASAQPIAGSPTVGGPAFQIGYQE